MGLAVNATLVNFVGNSRGSKCETVTFLLRPDRFFGVVRIFGKRYNSFWCVVSGFVATDPISLVPALIRTVGRAGVANCVRLEQVKLSNVLVH